MRNGGGGNWIPAFAGMTERFNGNDIRAVDRDCFVAAFLAMTRGCKDGKGNGLE